MVVMCVVGGHKAHCTSMWCHCGTIILPIWQWGLLQHPHMTSSECPRDCLQDVWAMQICTLYLPSHLYKERQGIIHTVTHSREGPLVTTLSHYL